MPPKESVSRLDGTNHVPHTSPHHPRAIAPALRRSSRPLLLEDEDDAMAFSLRKGRQAAGGEGEGGNVGTICPHLQAPIPHSSPPACHHSGFAG